MAKRRKAKRSAGKKAGPSPEKLREYERQIRRKGRDVADALAELLAGQNVRLENIKLPQERDAKEDPVIRLRRFLDLLNRIAASISEGTFGTCRLCERPISEPELDGTPWVTVCQPCAARSSVKLASLQEGIIFPEFR